MTEGCIQGSLIERFSYTSGTYASKLLEKYKMYAEKVIMRYDPQQQSSGGGHSPSMSP